MVVISRRLRPICPMDLKTKKWCRRLTPTVCNPGSVLTRKSHTTSHDPQYPVVCRSVLERVDWEVYVSVLDVSGHMSQCPLHSLRQDLSVHLISSVGTVNSAGTLPHLYKPSPPWSRWSVTPSYLSSDPTDSPSSVLCLGPLSPDRRRTDSFRILQFLCLETYPIFNL